MTLADKIKNELRDDYTWNRAARLGAKGAHALPRASAEYILDKFPIVSWLPRYDYRWVFNDVIAGLTVGVLLIPQGLSYAKIADIPVQYGLMSSWLPSAVYAVMGTSKDLSTGPTSVIGLLTSEVVAELRGQYRPVEVASAMAFMMGVYGIILGFLKLGFLLEFISLPILSGFISAVAISIIVNQVDSFLGETGVRGETIERVRGIFRELPRANAYAFVIGLSGVVFLVALDLAYRRWSNFKTLWLLSITRSFLCLVLFTGIGYAVNKDIVNPDDYVFDVVAVNMGGQEAPTIPKADLLSKVAGRSIAAFLASAIEHTAIVRGFAVRNNYVTDQSQELSYYGVINLVNSFFHAMGVSGAMSRTAVNSACNVKSPLSGLVTTAIVLISIFKLVGTLYWIPKATLSAIVICAVVPVISSPTVFYRYWKSSLADFISSMLAFWLSLFVSTEMGIACAVGFNVVYVVFRQVFTRVTSTSDVSSHSTTQDSDDDHDVFISGGSALRVRVPMDTRIFRLHDSLFFANAYGVRTSVLDGIQTYHGPAPLTRHGEKEERNWSVVAEQRIKRLRRRAGVGGADDFSLPRIRLVVVDFSRVNHIDTTAVTHLRSTASEIVKYGGEAVELRFVGMSAYVRRRFERMGWHIEYASANSVGGSAIPPAAGEARTRMYPDVASAVAAPRADSDGLSDEEADEKEIEYARYITAGPGFV